jgi:hypothetical protein
MSERRDQPEREQDAQHDEGCLEFRFATPALNRMANVLDDIHVVRADGDSSRREGKHYVSILSTGT